jgi:DNA polymerase delta subunit 2
MLLNSSSPQEIAESNDEGTKCLHRIKQTLEIRHLCPSAPDTLRVYPFKESDPFVISPIDDNLNLGEDDETAA